MQLSSIFTALLASTTSATFRIESLNDDCAENLRPLLLWHGMGDSYNSSSMGRVAELITEENPKIPVYSIYVDADNEADQNAGIVGNLTAQMEYVCAELHNRTLTEFDAIGFSQGGFFLRSLLETCPDIQANNLVTFGSPHNGVYDVSLCNPSDWICKGRNQLLRKQVYRDNVQKTSIQAQYFRDVYNYEEYLEKSEFIVKVNNDNIKNPEYAERLVANLKGHFVMVMFDQDTTLVPKESAWFYDFDPVTEKTLTFTETESFKENLIGLQDLYRANKIQFKKIDDQHMRIGDEFLRQVVKEFTGGSVLNDFSITNQYL